MLFIKPLFFPVFHFETSLFFPLLCELMGLFGTPNWQSLGPLSFELQELYGGIFFDCSNWLWRTWFISSLLQQQKQRGPDGCPKRDGYFWCQSHKSARLHSEYTSHCCFGYTGFRNTHSLTLIPRKPLLDLLRFKERGRLFMSNLFF